MGPISTSKNQARTYCDWLHYNVALDAHGVIRPCREGDYKGSGGFDFGNITSDSDFFNTKRYTIARKFALGERTLSKGPDQLGCFGCKYRPGPETNLGAADGWLNMFGNGISADYLVGDPVIE